MVWTMQLLVSTLRSGPTKKARALRWASLKAGFRQASSLSHGYEEWVLDQGDAGPGQSLGCCTLQEKVWISNRLLTEACAVRKTALNITAQRGAVDKNSSGTEWRACKTKVRFQSGVEPRERGCSTSSWLMRLVVRCSSERCWLVTFSSVLMTAVW